MNWSNWVYLVVGIALGIGFRQLLVGLKRSPNSSDVKPKDVSMLMEQMKQTHLAYQMAKEIGQFKAGFLARTTHVLRSPLNGLIGLHQLILSDLCENPEEEREFIAQAHERALKLLKLIDEILSVARTQHGTNKLNLQPLQLAEIIQEVHNLTYMLAENRNFPFNVLLPDPEIYVLGDFSWLRQVLVKLIDTTISKMDEGSIYITAGVIPKNKFAYIWLDIPTDAISWSEPIDLLSSKQEPNDTDKNDEILASGMKLLLNQTVLEAMGGKLEIVPYTQHPEQQKPQTELLFGEGAAKQVSRLQVSIPLVIPEDELQE
ncbi:HAMP domain-containing histidine kinase [Aetokthonos hydrillicola Thurmond2011]|jgi:K+-sensing histidine kinase KdpD|uniref:histidine kinase n=1 Tax=Aetokthonos hydrillicola Thurmond2011 TaxID=2712845 RepID=A0AAP5MAT1_9CYAN|nr:HAMP domain-containing sensor histidine kinase [Aetokthonos hydrillicola]MBO3458111.1 HAMP domain-containing histidine kinase [Aetokthonos hydrillicola CCALA 1050]MBW4584332.1 HAMP domain-containing histidine kinase [Aetokthonos hydrillicola CCALA 1050]MDR9898460.1 HAMP domain-containing histidine kinase [Aetokthonos hydrillicola Thurmond2011]